MTSPKYGHVDGKAVHATTLDHLPTDSKYARFNKALAEKITGGVGSMTCAYIFAALALISLPAAILSGSVIVIVAWIAQTFLQLVLLSVIIVGQNIQSQASDARAAKTFEDTETILDKLDLDTEGGLQQVLAAIESLKPKARRKSTNESK